MKKICVSTGLVLCLLWVIFTAAAAAAAAAQEAANSTTSQDQATVTMHCPSIFSANDTANEVSCDVNTDEVGKAKCVPLPSTLSFVVHKSATSDLLCAVDYKTDKCGAAPPEGVSCWCSGVDGNIKSFRFLYMGDPADAEGKLTCTVCALQTGREPISEDLGNCENVTFVPEPETTSKPPHKSEKGGAGNPKSSLLGIMLPVAAALLPKTC